MDATPETTDEWEKTLIDTSKKLMQITLTHYTQLLATLNTKIQELEELIQHIQLSEEPTNTLTEDQEQRITQLQQKLEHTRTRKLHTLKNPTANRNKPPRTASSRPPKVHNSTQEHFLLTRQKHQSCHKPPALMHNMKALLPTPIPVMPPTQVPHTHVHKRTLLPTPDIPCQPIPLMQIPAAGGALCKKKGSGKGRSPSA